jgi:hypothetical protein
MTGPGVYTSTYSASFVARFWRRVDVKTANECWPWRGRTNGKGYAQIRLDGRSGPLVVVHRVAYELTTGPIPTGMDLDHTCHNADPTCRRSAECPHRRCVNPAHLEPTTHLENCRRGTAGRYLAERTHCRNGHPFEGDNLVVVQRSNGTSYRQCRICRQASARRSYLARKAAAA